MITIIDYGLGNIRSFANVYERLNIQIKIAKCAQDIKSASKIILPGVGAFDHAMTLLNQSGMRDELDFQVIKNTIPVLGICVGMQIMAKYSDEGKLPGLGWIDGHVRLFNSAAMTFKPHLPHMGWNTIKPVKKNQLLFGFDTNPRFYFLHSYYFLCNDNEDVISTTDYGITYASAVNRSNIYGVQFHPEKSHSNGIQLLNNFARL